MKDYPQQKFREEILADHGYKFVKLEGEDAIWRFTGFKVVHTVKVTPEGKEIDVETRIDNEPA